MQTESLQTETAHEAGPHIPALQGETLFSAYGFDITTTVISMWILMIGIIIPLSVTLFVRKNKVGRIRSFAKNSVRRLDGYFTSLIGDRETARKFFPVVGGYFVFIFLANIAGLIFDWIGLIFPHTLHYLRPINSDLSTTLVLGASIILISQAAAVVYHGFFAHVKHYVFNFSGHSVVEKIINVPIGWIHFIGEFSRVLSLSVRLFCNIFAGIALIGIMSYLGTMIPTGIGGLLVLPFWFFEIMVAFLQAFIFMTLAGVYLQEATARHTAH